MSSPVKKICPSAELSYQIISTLLNFVAQHKQQAFFIISPGLRNAPIVQALSFYQLVEDAIHLPATSIHCHSVIDERSAAFVALGIKESRPNDFVILICTSGSAIQHYLPAIAEASKTGNGLIILSTDRPPRLVDSNAPQTTNQQTLFSPHCDIQLYFDSGLYLGQNPIRELTPLLEALTSSLTLQSQTFFNRSIHINCALSEPLIVDSSWRPQLQLDRHSFAEITHSIEHFIDLKKWKDFFSLCPAHWLMGQIPQKSESIFLSLDNRRWWFELWNISGRPKLWIDITHPWFRWVHEQQFDWSVFLEKKDLPKALALSCEGFSPHQALQEWQDEIHDVGVFHIGGRLTSKWTTVWPDKKIFPDSQVSTLKVWHLSFHPYQQILPGQKLQQYFFIHKHQDFITFQRLTDLLSSSPISEISKTPNVLTPDAPDTPEGSYAKEMSSILNSLREIGEIDELFLANSSTIRWFDLAKDLLIPSLNQHPFPRIWTQRGINGIDGNIHHFMGILMAQLLKEKNKTLRAAIVLGDVSFIHDFSAIISLSQWMEKHELKQLKLALIIANDQGGSIFKAVTGNLLAEKNSWEKFLITPHHQSLSHFWPEKILGPVIDHYNPNEKRKKNILQSWWKNSEIKGKHKKPFLLVEQFIDTTASLEHWKTLKGLKLIK